MWFKSLLFLMLLVVLGSSYYFYQQNQMVFGNDSKAIKEIIESKERYENKNISLLDSKDFGDLRVAGFLSNRNPSIIEFKRDEDGNYRYQGVETRFNEDLSSFLIRPLTRDNKKAWMMYVTNRSNKVAKMEVEVNDEKVTKDFKYEDPNVYVIKLPSTNKQGYTFRNYKYFNASGEQVES